MTAFGTERTCRTKHAHARWIKQSEKEFFSGHHRCEIALPMRR